MLKGVQIGSFELVELLGVGGMGQVWRGRHVTARVEVAIKCLTIERVSRDDSSAGFLHEVQSLARLRHPNIAAILDIGTLDRDLDPLEKGSPYMIQEYVRGEHLRRVRAEQRWEWLAEIVSQLLSALAHSHARGLVHRDLKPSNILITPSNHIKLVDFGIARVRDDLTSMNAHTQTSGTPKYMAPEQFRGEGRLQGPWTDLYALGCLVWELVTGSPPFVGSLYELMKSHTSARPAELVPLFDVPAELEAWLGVLLRKDPRARFRRAADALHAFEALDSSVLSEATPAGEIDLVAQVGDPTMQLEADMTMQLDSADDTSRELELETTRHGFVRPPLPEDWRDATIDARSLSWSALGEGLWGLTALPMIGREAERDQLWSALCGCDRDHRPRVLSIDAPLGQGKSHLVEWFASRAYELGAVHVLRAGHSEQGSHRDGMIPMFEVYLETRGLDTTQCAEFLGMSLPVEIAISHDRLAASLAPDTGETRCFMDPRERDAIWAGFFEQLARERPVVVILEDAHLADEALRFVSSFLERKRRCPILFVLTIELDARKATADTSRLEAILAAPEATRISLAPLGLDAQRELFSGELGLEPKTANKLIDCAGGELVAAMQMLGHWLEQNYLRKTSAGLVLESDAVILSEDLAAILSLRLDHLCAKEGTLSPDVLRRQLEVATALGREILMSEWDAACFKAFGVPGSRRLVGLLVAHNLAAHRIEGWAFTHELLCHCLERHARSEGRWSAAHELIVKTLAGHGVDRLRLAHHQRSAGQLAAALTSLIEAARRAFILGEGYRVRGILEQMEPMITELNLPDDHSVRLDYRILLSRWERLTGAQTEVTRERLERVVKRARWDNMQRELADALLALAQVQENANRLDEAIAAVREGIPLARELDDPETLATFLMRLGMYLNWTNKGAEALPHLEEARQISDAHGLLLMQVYTRHKLGHVLPSLQDVARARHVLQEAIEMANKIGSSTLRAATYNMLGNLASSQDDYATARANYERASALHQGVIERSYLIAQCNLGRLDIREERWRECEERSIVVLERARELNLRRIASHAVIPIVYTASRAESLARWDHFMETMDDIQNSVVTESTCVELLTKTATELLARGESARARRVLAYLVESYEKLGMATELAWARGWLQE